MQFMLVVLGLAMGLAMAPVWAQGRLPPCPGAYNASTWTNCVGETTSISRQRYSGEFRDGKRNGQGTLTLPDGQRYVGEFRNDNKHGKGVHYLANGSVLQSGIWENDRFVSAQAAPAAKAPATRPSPAAKSEPPARAAPPPQAPAAAQIEFELVNQSSQTIYYLNVAPANSSAWGEDRLGDGTLSAGERIKIRLPRDGQCIFNIRVSYADDSTEDRRGQNLCTANEIAFNGAARVIPPSAKGPASTPGGGTAKPSPSTGGAKPPPVDAARSADFFLLNRTSQNIVAAFVTPTSVDKWGDDRLPGIVAPGDSFEIVMPRDGQCQFDVRVVYSDKSSEERRAQNLCATAELAFDGSARRPPTGAAAGSAPKPAPPQARGPSFGTGFFVSAQGHALTNNHVIEGCGTVLALIDGKAFPTLVMRADQRNDLALVRAQFSGSVQFARFRAAPSIRAGESVMAAGFPLPNVLQNGLNITLGNVSALAGLGGNTALLQVTAPVQPGNSGGPLLDMAGNIVGVVVSKLDAMRIEKTYGDIPQNINFAVQGAVARLFLEAAGQRVEERSSAKELRVGDVSDIARQYTFQLECRP